MTNNDIIDMYLSDHPELLRGRQFTLSDREMADRIKETGAKINKDQVYYYRRKNHIIRATPADSGWGGDRKSADWRERQLDFDSTAVLDRLHEQCVAALNRDKGNGLTSREEDLYKDRAITSQVLDHMGLDDTVEINLTPEQIQQAEQIARQTWREPQKWVAPGAQLVPVNWRYKVVGRHYIISVTSVTHQDKIIKITKKSIKETMQKIKELNNNSNSNNIINDFCQTGGKKTRGGGTTSIAAGQFFG